MENQPLEAPPFLKKEWLSQLKSGAVVVPRPPSSSPPHFPHSRMLCPPLLYQGKLELPLSILEPVLHPNLEEHNP